MKIIIRLFPIVVLMALNSACNSVDLSESTKPEVTTNINEQWKVTSVNGHKLIAITETKTIDVLREALDTRVEVKLKRLPQFDFELVVEKNGGSSTWLYSTSGYVMSKNDQQKKTFKAKLNLLNKMLQ